MYQMYKVTYKKISPLMFMLLITLIKMIYFTTTATVVHFNPFMPDFIYNKIFFNMFSFQGGAKLSRFIGTL